MKIFTQDQIKGLLGARAAEYVEEGMLVGLGTGSTAERFIESLIHRCKEGLKITAVSSSLRSQEQAKRGGITLADFQKVERVDLTVDGADEIDPQFRLIKGGGGAHLREKILAAASDRFIVIADETKLVTQLGKCSLPVEIIPFGITSTIKQMEALGFVGSIRNGKDGTPFLTDNNNYIFDVLSPHGFSDPEKTDAMLRSLPAVIETGFFFNLTSEVLIGYVDGHIETRKKTI